MEITKKIMKRVAFKMFLKAGCVEEYTKRHLEIWPKLMNLLKESGIQDYSIFLDKETWTLFAFQRQNQSFDTAKLHHDPIMKEWWTYMKDLMETNPDHSPKTVLMEEVFFLP